MKFINMLFTLVDKEDNVLLSTDNVMFGEENAEEFKEMYTSKKTKFLLKKKIQCTHIDIQGDNRRLLMDIPFLYYCNSLKRIDMFMVDRFVTLNIAHLKDNAYFKIYNVYSPKGEVSVRFVVPNSILYPSSEGN